jgi:transposase
VSCEETGYTTRQFHSSEEKIRVVLSGHRGQNCIADLRRKEGIAQILHYSWSKEFIDSAKMRLAGGTARQATAGGLKAFRVEAFALKLVVTGLTLESSLLKKNERGCWRRAVS